MRETDALCSSREKICTELTRLHQVENLLHQTDALRLHQAENASQKTIGRLYTAKKDCLQSFFSNLIIFIIPP